MRITNNNNEHIGFTGRNISTQAETSLKNYYSIIPRPAFSLRLKYHIDVVGSSSKDLECRVDLLSNLDGANHGGVEVPHFQLTTVVARWPVNQMAIRLEDRHIVDLVRALPLGGQPEMEARIWSTLGRWLLDYLKETEKGKGWAGRETLFPGSVVHPPRNPKYPPTMGKDEKKEAEKQQEKNTKSWKEKWSQPIFLGQVS